MAPGRAALAGGRGAKGCQRAESRPADRVPPCAQATLGTGNLHEAVTLPAGEDGNEWLAVNTVRAAAGVSHDPIAGGGAAAGRARGSAPGISHTLWARNRPAMPRVGSRVALFVVLIPPNLRIPCPHPPTGIPCAAVSRLPLL
jgi:hypothetical protein